MTLSEELVILRAALVLPGGKVVGLRFAHGSGYFGKELVQAAIIEYGNAAMRCFVLGEKATALEQIAIHLLRDSAGLE